MMSSGVRTDASEDVSTGDHDVERRPRSWSTPPRWSLHLAAVLWSVVLAGALLAPALTRGWMVGTYDLLATKGLTSRPSVVVHGLYANTDVVSEMIQWTTLNWTQVHHGVLPLWNPYNGTGLPLAFNWQSASFGVPSLIGYLLPIHDAYTAAVLATLVIAGTGAYVLARVLRMGFLGALMAATVFELGGPLMGWLGYPHGQVLAWGGWLFAAGLLVIRGTRRMPAITLLAVVIACSIYAGQPETLILMLGAMAVFLIVVLALRATPSRMGFASGPIRRPVVDLVIAIVAGLGLGAPLLLPGVQLASASVRSTTSGNTALPVHDLTYLIFSGFDGVPVPGGLGVGSAFFYGESAAYVGIIAVVLACVAVVVGFRRRRPEVLAAAAVVLAMGLLAYLGPLDSLIYKLPLIGQVQMLRALMPLSLALAILAGMGLDAIVRSPSSRTVRVSLLYGFGAAALLLAGLWLLGRGGGYQGIPSVYRAAAAHERAENFLWPVVGVGVGLAASVLLWWRVQLRVVSALALLVCESLFLITAGSILIGSNANGSPQTPAISALRHAIGDSVVGTGPNTGCSLGITPEANIAYQVHESNLYDPVVPKAFFTTWQQQARTPPGLPILNLFCPFIETAAQARLLGVGYVLVDSGKPGPAGGVFVTQLKVPRQPPAIAITLGTQPGNEDLYRIPGAARATLTPIRSHAPLPPPDAPGSAVAVNDSNPARWSLTTNASTPTVLRLHLTDVPGWHATIDGRPLQLESLSGLMFQARIPAGRHAIELHYWPATFTAGLIIAVVTALALIAALGTQLYTRRRRDSDNLHESQKAPAEGLEPSHTP